MKKQEAIFTMNELGQSQCPFYFIIDFKMDNCLFYKQSEAFSKNVLFNIEGNQNYPTPTTTTNNIQLLQNPVSLQHYQNAFEKIQQHLHLGNTYLTNLTMPTPLGTNASLTEIFHASKAKYKLLFKNEFVCFSPESFVKIDKQKISTYPMKGTIDATLPNSEGELINNRKELAEHATIVDLLRNDLSKIASNVTVDKFRYIEKITSNHKQLLQVSSKISGDLPNGFQNNLGDILFSLLPAGSISGAPKQKTIEIINEAENYKRGFYTGIAGFFDGQNLNSFVLIRFIENNNEALVYKSGGGITAQSKLEDEYQELIDKIYVPTS